MTEADAALAPVTKVLYRAVGGAREGGESGTPTQSDRCTVLGTSTKKNFVCVNEWLRIHESARKKCASF